MLGESDVHWTNDGNPSFLSRGFRLEARDLASVEPASERRLVGASGDPWTLVHDALVAPLLGGGSTVIVQGVDTDGRIEGIRKSERIG